MQEHESRMVDVGLTALPMAIAVLDQQGIILHISAAWQAFALAYGMPSVARAGIGTHYLAVTEPAVHDHIDSAYEVQEGISAVLAGVYSASGRRYNRMNFQEMLWTRD